MPARFQQLTFAISLALLNVQAWLTQQYLLLCQQQRKRRQFIALLTAIAALTYLLSALALHNSRQQLGQQAAVFVATQNLEPGDIVDFHVYSTRQIPMNFISPSAVKAVVAGMVVQQRIAVGDVLSFTNVGMPQTLTEQLPNNFRAVAIVLRTVMPTLQPGSTVDVIANGVLLAANGTVLYVLPDSNTVVIAVPVEVSPAVASAAAIGDATLVVSS
jgi:hypothetical protein